MPLTPFTEAILTAASHGDHALSSAIADLAEDATLPDAGEPLGEEDEAEKARERLRARMWKHLGWKERGGDTSSPDVPLAESATAVSSSDFAGQQMLQVTGKVKRTHLEGEGDQVVTVTASDDTALDAVSAADLAVRHLQAILDGEQPFDAATLVDLLGRLNPEEAARVLDQVGITPEELEVVADVHADRMFADSANISDVFILAESEVKDSLGRTQCYDDSSGKHIPCGGSSGGEADSRPFDRQESDSTQNSFELHPHAAKAQAMTEAFHADERMATIDQDIDALVRREAFLNQERKRRDLSIPATMRVMEERKQTADKLRETRALRESSSRKAFLAHFALPEQDRAPKPHGEAKAGTKQAKDWEQASDFLSQIMHASMGQQSVRIIPTQQRASYSSGTIKASDTDDAGVHAHEFGHHLEAGSPWIQEQVARFRAARYSPEDDRPMAEVAPGCGYGDEEIGNPDKMLALFKGDVNQAHYTGVTYAGGRETEVVSMGIEMLFRHPVHFATADPEFFHFITGLLQADRGEERQGEGIGGEQHSPMNSTTPEVMDAITAHVRDSRSTTAAQKAILAVAVQSNHTDRKALHRVSGATVNWRPGQAIDLDPTSFTSSDIPAGKSAGQIGWKSTDKAIVTVESPSRGLDVDYRQLPNLNMDVAGEGETILAGRYRVKEVRKVPEPGTKPQDGYTVPQYILEEV